MGIVRSEKVGTAFPALLRSLSIPIPPCRPRPRGAVWRTNNSRRPLGAPRPFLPHAPGNSFPKKSQEFLPKESQEFLPKKSQEFLPKKSQDHVLWLPRSDPREQRDQTLLFPSFFSWIRSEEKGKVEKNCWSWMRLLPKGGLDSPSLELPKEFLDVPRWGLGTGWNG